MSPQFHTASISTTKTDITSFSLSVTTHQSSPSPSTSPSSLFNTPSPPPEWTSDHEEPTTFESPEPIGLIPESSECNGVVLNWPVSMIDQCGFCGQSGHLVKLVKQKRTFQLQSSVSQGNIIQSRGSHKQLKGIPIVISCILDTFQTYIRTPIPLSMTLDLQSTIAKPASSTLGPLRSELIPPGTLPSLDYRTISMIHILVPSSPRSPDPSDIQTPHPISPDLQI
ncbi:hypothetical protein F4604DRAFT_1925826 [Suillus subluteus]|nr:hypothetical protein F4604DRAFT_1925826 [Suillus subluteus]